jgi:hypothetical protein
MGVNEAIRKAQQPIMPLFVSHDSQFVHPFTESTLSGSTCQPKEQSGEGQPEEYAPRGDL